MAQSWYQLDWIWTTTAWLLAALGTLLLLWSLFGDRAHGRKRCPKCWYDMSGVLPRTDDGREHHICPECGTHIRSPRRLHKTRRRWAAIPIACLVLLCAYAASGIPQCQQGGWVRLVPSTYLALCAETTDWSVQSAVPMSGAYPPPWGGPSTPTELIGEEAWRRVQASEMWAWQVRWFLTRAINADPLGPKIFRSPARWVAGTPLPVHIKSSKRTLWPPLYAVVNNSRRFVVQGDVWFFDTPNTPSADIPIRLCFDAARGRVELPLERRTCHLEATIEDLFSADTSEALSAAAIGLLHPRIVIDPLGKVRLQMNDRSASPEWQRLRTGLGCEAKLFVGDRPAGVARFWPNWRRELDPNRSTVSVDWIDGMQQAAERSPESIRLHFTGSIAMSFQAYREWPFDDDHPTCWTGAADCIPELIREGE
jgi:hypothetical protein